MFVGPQRVTHDSGWNSNRSAATTTSKHVYEIRPLKDRHGFELISDRLPLGLLWFKGTDALVDAVMYAKYYSSSHRVIIRVFDESGAVIGTHQSAGSATWNLNPTGGDWNTAANWTPATCPRRSQ
jgi:hypothetical protein